MNYRNLLPGLILLAGLSTLKAAEEKPVGVGYQTKEIEGWTLQIRDELLEKQKAETARALELLTAQLKEIKQVVPSAAVTELQKVILWISPEYSGVQARAEYHPDAGWLRENKRNPAMARGVEFTNVRTFESETKRMPNFVLHELAHSYHDRVLPRGFGHPEIKAAYDRAKSSDKYARVEQRFGDGRSAKVRAYAMSSPMEYFAESTEAFFSTNDFFPFTHDELAKHDPEMCELLQKLWGVTANRK